jgi:hypothetical protein
VWFHINLSLDAEHVAISGNKAADVASRGATVFGTLIPAVHIFDF